MNTIEEVLNNAINEGVEVPDEVSMSSEVSILVDVKNEKEEIEKQEWVYRFDLLSPFQSRPARNILLYEHELQVSPLSSHIANIESSIYDVELSFFELVLVRKIDNDTYDTYDEKKAASQRTAARKAIQAMRNADEKLDEIKKNFCSTRNVPLQDRTQQYKNLTLALKEILLAFSPMKIKMHNLSES